MKFGIRYEESNERQYLGASKYSKGKYAQHFDADIDVSPEVERAVELTRPIWSQIANVPLLNVDQGDHGHDRGLVITAGLCDLVEGDHKDFIKSELITRISFGGNADTESFKTDYTRPQRLHVSVYGARQFFPKEWRKLPTQYGEHRENRTPVTSVIEEAHVSFRWLNGEFNDWDNIDEWLKNAGRAYHENPHFNEMRTSFCVSRLEQLRKKTSTVDLELDKARRLVRRMGRKRHFIPLSPEMIGRRDSFDSYAHINEVLRKVFNDGVRNHIPIVGYEAVSRYLNELGGDFLPSIYNHSKEPQIVGVEFLFGKVLPKMQRFISL